MKKRLMSLLLCLCMVLGLLPTMAWATGETNSIQIGQVTLESGGIYVPASENTDPNKGTGNAGNPVASIRVVDKVTAAPAGGGYLTCDGTTVTVHGAVVLPDGSASGIAASGAVTLDTGTKGTDSLTLTMTSGGSALTVNDGGTLTLTGGGALTLSHSGSTPAVYGSFSNPGSLTTSGFTGDIAITSAGGGGAVQNLTSVNLTTTGTLSLTGTSSSPTVAATGSVTLSGNSVALTNSGAGQLCSGGSVSVASTGSGALSLSGTCSAPLLSAGSGAVTLASGGDLTVANSGTGVAVNGRLVIGNGSTGTAGAGAKNVTLKGTISGSAEVSATGAIAVTGTIIGDLTVGLSKGVAVTSAGSSPTIGGAVSINAMVDADTNDVTITNTGSSMAVSGTLNVTNAKNVTVSSQSGAPTISGNTRIDAAGDVSITNSAYMAVGGTLDVTSASSFTATGSGTDPTIGGIDHQTKKVSVKALNDITIANTGSGAAIGIATPSLTSRIGAIFLTSSGATTVTPHGGTAVTAANGGDVTATGLDLKTSLPAAATYYKAGRGCIIFTPAVTTGTVANAKLALYGATIDLSTKTDATNAITLPNAPVDVTVTGSNTLKAAGSGSGSGGNGIYASADLNISGSGSLDVSGGNFGIYCTQDGALTVNIAGALNASGKYNAAVECGGNISITAASVTADSPYYSVHSSGGAVSVTATSGDITLTRTSTGSSNVSGSAGIVLTANAGKITVTGGANSIESTTGNVTVTAGKDVAVTGSSSDGIKGAAVSLTSDSGSIKVGGGYHGITATQSVTLSAPNGDVTVEGKSSGYAVNAFGLPVTVTAGGTVSSTSPWGWNTGALTIQANRVAITGTKQDALISLGSAPGITITNPTGGNCTSVNLTANGGSDRAAINCFGGDVTVKAASMVIQGKTSAKAIVCGSGSANKVLTLTGAGCVIGTCSLYPAKAEQAHIDSAVIFYDTAEAASTAGIVDWPSDDLDLSSYKTETTFLTDGGTAVWQPTMDGTTFKSGTLTLNGAQTDAILALPDCDVTIALGNAASRTGEISVSQSLTAARALTISGPGSLAADGINISNNTYSCALTINGGAQVTSSTGIAGGNSGSLTVTGSGTKLTATDEQSYSGMKDFAVTDHASASFTGGLAGLALTGTGSVTTGASLTVNGGTGLVAGTGFTVDSASSFDATGTAAAVMGLSSANPFHFVNLPSTMEYQSTSKDNDTYWSVVAKGGTLGMDSNNNLTGAAATLKLSPSAVLSDVKFTPASQTVGQTFSVAATLKNADGIPLVGQHIAFRFVGGSIDTTVWGTTDTDGVAEIVIAPSDIPFPAGTYAVTISYAGSGSYGPAALTTSCTFTAASASTGSGGGSTGSTGTKVTVPVSSGEGSVKVEATVKDGTAAVTLTDAQITEIASGKSDTGTVKLDVSSLDVKAATIPAKVIAAADKSGNTDGIQVALPTGTVTLDKTALAAVSDKGGDVTVSVDKVDNAKLTETQKAVLGAQAETALVVDVTVLASGEKVSAFDGGSIGVAVPYTPKANEDTSKLVVWFINDDGSIEPKTGSYNAKTGKFEFQTQHLSQYVLVSFPFKDVSANSWYYGSVAYAYMNGLFSGTGDTTFSPARTMTRGMLVTVLYRMAGSPAVTESDAFTDVAADAYYAKAVAWASANKLVTGYAAATFAPNDTVTRQQMAAILYRYASLKAYDVGGAASLNGFADSASVSDYAKSALAWAVNGGLVKGSDNKLMPGSGATRAQVAAILQRFQQKIVK